MILSLFLFLAPTFSEAGTCSQFNTGSISDPSVSDTAWALPSAEFRNPGRVIALEVYISDVGSGQLDFLVSGLTFILKESCFSRRLSIICMHKTYWGKIPTN